jgi:uncharacterized membrane protein
MGSHLKLFGHPIHPMLVVFPLGLLSAAVLFDLLYVVSDNGDLAVFSYWALVAGLVGGLAAAVFGLLDWFAIPGGTRARRIGLIHGVGNVGVVILFAISLFLRLDDARYLPDLLPFLFGVLGALLAVVTSWLGGELVYRLGVGVDDDASLDASSSLRRDEAIDIVR